jgi:succinate dehydrogenase/fumarate reductase flavoprotein subunit
MKMMKEFKTIESDVLVIGGGGAGIRAAIEADKQGARTVLAEKLFIGKSGATSVAGGGYTIAIEGWRSIEECFNIYVQTGWYLNDQNLAWILWNENQDRLKELIDWGSPVTYRGDRIKWPLVSGQTMLKGLVNELARHPNINVMENTVVTKLLTSGGEIAGATALDYAKGEFILFEAKAIIMATGGFGQLFYPSECMPLGMPIGTTGDGNVVAYNVGAELCDMEFTQQAWIPARPLWMEATRGHGFRVTGEVGPYFDKDGNVLVSREELHKLNPYGGYSALCLNRVYKEMKKQPLYVSVFEALRKGTNGLSAADKIIGVNLDNMAEWGLGKVEVALGPLDCSGGLRVNEKCEASILGLYCAGEAQGNLHGAFRQGGTYSETMVFGQRAGLYAAEYAKMAEARPIDVEEVRGERDRVYGFLEPKSNGVSPVEVKWKIWDLTKEHLYLIRNEKGLKEAIKETARMKEEYLPRIQAANIREFNLEWLEALEIPNLLDLAMMVVQSALFRTESRGAHFREDFPETDNENWLCHTLLKKEGDKMVLSKAPVVMTRIKPSETEKVGPYWKPIPVK